MGQSFSHLSPEKLEYIEVKRHKRLFLVLHRVYLRPTTDLSTKYQFQRCHVYHNWYKLCETEIIFLEYMATVVTIYFIIAGLEYIYNENCNISRQVFISFSVGKLVLPIYVIDKPFKSIISLCLQPLLKSSVCIQLDSNLNLLPKKCFYERLRFIS